jgi:NodT family efflux transporter outer membrane factor (OMF) lipoprotein
MTLRQLCIKSNMGLTTFAIIGALSLLSACSTTRMDDTLVANSQVALPVEYSKQKSPTMPSKPLVPPQKVASQALWWAQFGDPALEVFAKQALERNQDLLIALARIEQARAVQTRSERDTLPTLDLDASATRNRSSLNDPLTRSRSSQPGFARTTNTFRTDAILNWELDLFGRKDAIQSADQARLKAAEAYQQDIRLTVVSDVAKNVITARTQQTRIKLAEESAAIEGDIVAITSAKLRGGQISAADLLRAMSLEQDSKAAVARLQHDYGETIKTLAILLAERPEQIRLTLLSKLEQSSYSSAASSIGNAGLPSDLLRRRPDIKRAEFQLVAASKDLSATHAERFPKLQLGTTLALVAGTVSKLGGIDSLLATFAPSLSWRALDFGRLDADIARAKGIEKEALLAYKKSVTTAFAEADTALDDIARRQTVLQFTTASVAAQREAWDVVRLQYERGIIDLSAALDTKRALSRSEEANALAKQEQMLAMVTAYRALGGEWMP